MINVFCIKVGTKYTAGHVKALKYMVEASMGDTWKLRCLTDNPEGIYMPSIPITRVKSSRGVWDKVQLFRPGILPVADGDFCLYFDLDVLIVGDLTYLIRQTAATLSDETKKLVIIKDWSAHNRSKYNSSMMAWRASTLGHIWERFKDRDGQFPEYRGDQDLIEECMKGCGVSYWPPKAVLSYKLSLRGAAPPPGCKVVVFHGRPKPWDISIPWAT